MIQNLTVKCGNYALAFFLWPKLLNGVDNLETMTDKNRVTVWGLLEGLLERHHLEIDVAGGRIVEIRYPTRDCSSLTLMVDNGKHDEVAVPVTAGWVNEWNPACGGLFMLSRGGQYEYMSADEWGKRMIPLDKPGEEPVVVSMLVDSDSVNELVVRDMRSMETDSHYELGE